MARTHLTAVDMPGALDYDGTTITFAASDVANGNDVVFTGREVIIVRNDGGSPYTITIASAADHLGRTRDCVASLIATAHAVLGPFPKYGWDQAGYLNINGNNAGIMIAVVRLPASWAGR
jgi:hypothetical protein